MNNKLEDFQEQNVILKNRKNLDINGVKKIESLNPYEFVIITVLGKIIIKGESLEMKALDIDNGKLSVEGHIDSFTYFDKNNVKKKESGFVSKLFK